MTTETETNTRVAFVAIREDLLSALKLVAKAIPRQYALPILRSFHFRVDGDGVIVTGTDLELTVRAKIEAGASVESYGAFTVGAKEFLASITATPKRDYVTVAATDGRVEVTSTVGTVTLIATPVDDYPVSLTDAGKRVMISASELKKASEAVVTAASADQTRPILTAVKVEEGKNGVVMVTTDTYRLHVSPIDFPTDVLIPARVFAVANLIAPDAVEIGPRQAMFINETTRNQVAVRLIEGTFPNWKNLLPTNEPVLTVTIDNDKKPFVEWLRWLEKSFSTKSKRTSRYGNTQRHTTPVRLDFSTIGFQAKFKQQDVVDLTRFFDAKVEATETTEAIAQYGFTPVFLADLLDSFPATVRIRLWSPTKPILADDADNLDPDRLALLMPVRI